MSAIRTAGLSKTFAKSKRALREVSLEIAPGEMVARIGASWSGKSTLIHHIAGLVPADRNPGRCRVDVLGKPIQQSGRIARDARKARTDIGVVFQQFNLVGRLSVLTGVLGRISPLRGYLGLFSRPEKLPAMWGARPGRHRGDRAAARIDPFGRAAAARGHRAPWSTTLG